MNAKELRLKSPLELQRMAAEERSQLRDVRFKVATGQSTGVRKLRVLKREIARINTIASEAAAKAKAKTQTQS